MRRSPSDVDVEIFARESQRAIDQVLELLEQRRVLRELLVASLAFSHKQHLELVAQRARIEALITELRATRSSSSAAA